MSAASSKGPLLEQGLCRCCGSIKRCRILNVEYEWQGQKEVYSDMFMDCFGLLLSHLEGDDTERAVCATCVSRLRDASAFKQQVLSCENTLLKKQILVHEEDVADNDVKLEVLKVELDVSLPEHTGLSDDDPNDIDYAVDAAVDNDVSDTASVKSELKIKTRLRKVKPKKKSMKIKLGAKSKATTLVKKEYLKKKKALQNKLREEEENILIGSQTALEPRPKIIENEQKTFQNTVTIVENSYVCPFYTSFSDFYCIYCRETFTDPDKLRDHTLEHDPTSFKNIYDNKKFAQIDITRVGCRLCPQPIDNIDTLKQHLQDIHALYIFPITNEFLKFRLTINRISCTECNRTFKFFHALKKHMAEHFGTCICDVCGAHYFEERILLIHQKTHLKVPRKLYPCKECNKTFKSRHNCYLHEARVHKKEAAYPCSKCDEVFFTYTVRYRHLIEVHGEERLYACDNCDRMYDSRKSLREHVRRSHLKIMKHQCDQCDRRFYLPSRLKEHMSTHTGERNYRCEYCGKSYPRLRGLKVHMQSHSTDKKFRCVVCSASFTQNVNLRNHMKKQHATVPQSLDMIVDNVSYQSSLMQDGK